MTCMKLKKHRGAFKRKSQTNNKGCNPKEGNNMNISKIMKMNRDKMYYILNKLGRMMNWAIPILWKIRR